MRSRGVRPSREILASILDSRLDQMRAVTIPTDTDRHEILDAIRAIPTYDRKLASFLDYMIDYSATLSLVEASSRKSIRDYDRCLDLVDAADGGLLNKVMELCEENRRLRQTNERLLQNSTCTDLSELKRRFGKAERDLVGLSNDVERKFGRWRAQ